MEGRFASASIGRTRAVRGASRAQATHLENQRDVLDRRLTGFQTIMGCLPLDTNEGLPTELSAPQKVIESSVVCMTVFKTLPLVAFTSADRPHVVQVSLIVSSTYSQ